MWWTFFILFLLISVVTSTLLFYALRRINQYEEYLRQISEIITFASEKMKLVDAKGHYKSDDETGFFFEQIKGLQMLFKEIFENEPSEEKK